jgi:hypothetical protein
MQYNKHRVGSFNFLFQLADKTQRKIEQVFFVNRFKNPELYAKVSILIIIFNMTIKPPDLNIVIRIILLDVFPHVPPEAVCVKSFLLIGFPGSVVGFIVMAYYNYLPVFQDFFTFN